MKVWDFAMAFRVRKRFRDLRETGPSQATNTYYVGKRHWTCHVSTDLARPRPAGHLKILRHFESVDNCEKPNRSSWTRLDNSDTIDTKFKVTPLISPTYLLLEMRLNIVLSTVSIYLKILINAMKNVMLPFYNLQEKCSCFKSVEKSYK